MAEIQCSTDAIEKTDFEMGTRWRGTREALIAAGVCTADQFPQGRKRLAWDRDTHWNTRYLRGGVYAHEKWLTVEQREREQLLAQVKDPQTFRESMLSRAESLGRLLIDYASGDYERELAGEAHLWLDAEAQRRLAELQSQLVAIVETARICGPLAKPNLRLV